ncbi:hypothetical protein [Streptomyces sp. CBG31]|uniref:hypothetical protein n=1 Tax=Streptomyces sp. CBG31 TaxID=2762623 RepID=UPI0021BDE5D2|nr:hypothetical protein [Streptomyces sp. CBG31]
MWTIAAESAGTRWTPRQQRAICRELERTVADGKLPLYTRAAALARLAALPGRGADAVRAWVDAPDVVLAEAALAALARTDRPADTLPDLLAHAGDDRARVALYAAGRAAAHARPSRLRALLAARTAPGTGKVTARKEAVRLAAALLPLPDAAAVLADAYAEPGQHPDVRAACVASGAALLGDERMGEVMADAATGDRVLRTAVLRTHPNELDPATGPATRSWSGASARRTTTKSPPSATAHWSGGCPGRPEPPPSWSTRSPTWTGAEPGVPPPSPWPRPPRPVSRPPPR